MGKAQHHYSTDKHNRKPNQTLLEKMKLQKLTISSADKGVEEVELSDTAGRHIK